MFCCHDHYRWEARRVCQFLLMIQLNEGTPDEVDNVGNIALKDKNDPKRLGILNIMPSLEERYGAFYSQLYMVHIIS